jgi:hypothetical protein
LSRLALEKSFSARNHFVIVFRSSRPCSRGVGPFEERNQYIDGARAQRNPCAVLQQPSVIGLQLEGSEAVAFRAQHALAQPD